jgi:hypothetical protein
LSSHIGSKHPLGVDIPRQCHHIRKAFARLYKIEQRAPRTVSKMWRWTVRQSGIGRSGGSDGISQLAVLLIWNLEAAHSVRLISAV